MGNELKKVYIDNDGVEWDLEEDIGDIRVNDPCAFCMEKKKK